MTVPNAPTSRPVRPRAILAKRRAGLDDPALARGLDAAAARFAEGLP